MVSYHCANNSGDRLEVWEEPGQVNIQPIFESPENKDVIALDWPEVEALAAHLSHLLWERKKRVQG